MLSFEAEVLVVVDVELFCADAMLHVAMAANIKRYFFIFIIF
jgi:hypothetical protein